MADQFPGGYNGKILRENLSAGGISTEPIEAKFCREYLGGAGFVAYFLWKELKPHIAPLGAENKLIFALGPLSGVPISGSGRNCVGAKSPLTNGLAKSEMGGFWGAELKRAGFDAIIIEGKAKQPCYLWVKDGEAVLKDARQLWGLKTKESQQAIQDELADPRVRVALIGPGGERLVPYACIMSGLKDAAGRGGLGAVMGSKNLKAIAVRGHQAPKVVNPEPISEVREWLKEHFQYVFDFHEFGTGGAMAMFEKQGNLPVRKLLGEAAFKRLKTSSGK